MNKLIIDMETRSRVDLKKCGVYVYAEDSSTDILCIAVKSGDERPQIWASDILKPKIKARIHVPIISSSHLQKLIDQADEIHAHNAQFERVMWDRIMYKRYGFKNLPFEKIRCTAAKAAYYSLPRALGEACLALNLAQKKDATGYRVMMKMCKPNSLGHWNEDEADIMALMHYCMQDVEAEHSLDNSLYDIPKSELEVYRLDQIINDRGIKADITNIENLIYKVEEKERRLLHEIKKISGGEIKSTRQLEVTKDWLKRNGVEVDDLRKETVKAVLSGDISKDAARMLQIRQSLAKSSVSKLSAMKRFACKDERIRGTLLYHGASTGRWSGKGIQPQNFVRDSYEEENILKVVELGVDGVDEHFGDTIFAASRCLRGMLMAAPGKTLYCADFSSIEARVLAWLAGEKKVLNAFVNKLDLYKVAAMDIYGVAYDQVTKEQRSVGKVSELALGYQGWVGAFEAMADGYGVDLKDYATVKQLKESGKKLTAEEEKDILEAPIVRIVKAWRENRPLTTAYWRGIETAAVLAVQTREAYAYGNIKFGMRGKFLHCRLPSGRLLSYYDPFMKKVKTKYGVEKEVIAFYGVDSYTNKWGVLHTYGGKLTENIVQAVARDLLVSGLMATEKAGYPTVLHCHDEVLSEMPEGTGDLKQFETLTASLPDWAAGLPLGAEGWTGKRYRKN